MRRIKRLCECLCDNQIVRCRVYDPRTRQGFGRSGQTGGHRGSNKRARRRVTNHAKLFRLKARSGDELTSDDFACCPTKERISISPKGPSSRGRRRGPSARAQ
ncbi:hypothetical protein EVAR_81511_1 [Eumeta japonica]|uniref:Uncharacterized protein n=1 Tax=Eumeta variegata TaxID=151549 RepID=A0A4C1W108_EUMVA|nr:hypothetical protein EVAR_81511_1 [Eumeta japonica]